LTIAIEEEYQIVDAVGELKAHTKTLLTEHGEALTRRPGWRGLIGGRPRCP
jgi:hypothetical protein